MIETRYALRQGDEKTIEKVVLDENVHILHMVLPKGDGLPEHATNANVYMTVLRGRLSIALGGEDAREYETGALLKIPIHTRMNARNAGDSPLELLVVKAPAPAGA